MSAGSIILLALFVAIWVAFGRRLWRAAARAGERSRMTYVVICIWPVVAFWLVIEMLCEVPALIRKGKGLLP